MSFNLLSVSPTKWSNTPKQFVGKMLTSFLSVFDHFVELVLKGLTASPFLEPVYTSGGRVYVPSVSLLYLKNVRTFAWLMALIIHL